MTPHNLRIVISTGGGDAPGLNAVIRAVVLAADKRGWEVFGSRNGYQGLLDTNHLVRLEPSEVFGIEQMGGTILGTTNKGNPFEFPVSSLTGEVTIRDLSPRVMENFKRLRFDAFIAVGGDGSLNIARRFAELGMPVIGIPKTIDNDLSGTVITFGLDTACVTATEALDKLKTTARSHERIFVVELMGRYAGWIALESGLAGGADVILIPEIPYDIRIVAEKILDIDVHGRKHAIVVVAEGAVPIDGKLTTKNETEAGRQEVVLGGIAERIAKELKDLTGKDTRHLVLGHLQRGGSPTRFDRLLGTRFGAAAIRFIEQGYFDTMVALDPPTVKAVPLVDAVSRMKNVPLDGDTIQTARDLSICLGD
ncbi:MAG: ATP-dependent 6-phosphofructokinase [Deltaproteobacteria bacterium]|nr:ATP-dependent 6-phosphofructokinase [Deltaproteobacteria bacterium]